MAVNPEDIQNSEELLNLSNSILNSYNERAKVLRGLSAEEKTYRDTISQQQKLSQQITANADKYIGYQIKSKDLSKQIAATENNRRKSQDAFSRIENSLYENKQKSERNIAKIVGDVNKKRQEINRLDEENDIAQFKRNEALRTGNDALASRLQNEIRERTRLADIETKKVEKLEKSKQTEISIAKSIKDIVKNAQEAAKAQDEEEAFLRKNLIIRKQIEKSTGLLGAISKSVAKIPGIGQYLNADEAIDEMEKLAASIAERGEDATSFGNRLKIAGKGLSTLAKGFYENIKSPEAVFTFFMKAALNANKESVNLSKNLGYGAANADRVRANFVGIERSANNLNVTTANLSEAFNELSTSTGFVTEYSADALTTQIKLTKQLGLSGDEAAGVYKFSVLTGKSSEQTYQSMLKGYVATRNSLNVGVPFKAAIAEAAKVSGQLASNLGNNPETIIKAVVATRALGTSLEQAKSQGEKLLDFQSSIENELKAELITGQQLNLERARAAALMGDQVTVAEELAAQGMTAAKFSGMNVIAQKSFAEALGTTSDELANQLAKREMAIASGKSLAQITAEEADEAATRQDIQTKFNAAMEKLQSIIGNLVAGPLGTMLEILSGVLGVVNKIGNAFSFLAGPLQAVASIWLTIKGIQLASLGYQKLSAAYEAAKTGYAIAQRGAALGYNGILLARQAIMSGELAKAIGIAVAQITGASATSFGVAAGIALAAGAAGYAFLSSTADDMIQPGYGKRTILSPEGAIQLNNNDTIVAGTNLGGESKLNSVRSSPAMDISPMISAINQVTAAVTTLNNKSWDVKLDSKSVGSGLMQNSYKSA
jgi:hypothetical protein